MDLGLILGLLLVLGYVILYFRGRYYKRENFDDDDGEPFEDDDGVDIIGSGY